MLMNHINEGIAVLDDICASEDAMQAFCIHPMLQADEDLAQNLSYVARHVPAYVVALAIEYRSVANEYLSPKIGTVDEIRLSPLKEVNDMLIADKVQNSKDFYLYHSDTHERADELRQYFNEWLHRLDIDPEYYAELCGVIEGTKVYENELQQIKERNKIYEAVFHKIQACSVGFQGDKIREIIGKICNWSYAHRVGNGELSDKEQQERIDAALDALEKKVKK